MDTPPIPGSTPAPAPAPAPESAAEPPATTRSAVHLSDAQRAELFDHLPHRDWCDYDSKGGCSPHFGCGVWKDRAALEATVIALIAAHTTPKP